MKEEKIVLTFSKAHITELNQDEQKLIEYAQTATNYAYAPYSGFLVGAAVQLENNEIVTGNNQENVAYPSGICAERVALYYAGSKFPHLSIQAIAIFAKAKSFELQEITSPCGACRQVMAEYQQKQKLPIKILLCNSDNQVLIVNSVEDLLPFLFKSDQLRKF